MVRRAARRAPFRPGIARGLHVAAIACAARASQVHQDHPLQRDRASRHDAAAARCDWTQAFPALHKAAELLEVVEPDNEDAFAVSLQFEDKRVPCIQRKEG